jgi:mono/diheme cytochrome c family protein
MSPPKSKHHNSICYPALIFSNAPNALGSILKSNHLPPLKSGKKLLQVLSVLADFGKLVSKTIRLIGAVGMITIVAASSASAQDVYNGAVIAKTWCSGCHIIDRSAPPVARTDLIPSFLTIAQMNSTTSTSLRVFLSTPHANMPDYNLTSNEIADVSAYILELRR